jgi:hypothetical protein
MAHIQNRITWKKKLAEALAESVDSIELLRERGFNRSMVRQGSGPTNTAAKRSEQSADARE